VPGGSDVCVIGHTHFMPSAYESAENLQKERHHQCRVAGKGVASLNSIATADGTPRQFHWWTARVPSNLFYPWSAGSTRASSPAVATRKTTNRCACGAPCAQERHSQAGQCVQIHRCDGPPGFRPWRKSCTCLHVDIGYWRSLTSEFLVSDAVTFHVVGL